MSFVRCARLLLLAALAVFFPTHSRASDFAVSQYGRVTATLPWAVALEKGYFADAGIKIDQIISGEGGGTTLRNMLASDLPYGEVATSAALAAHEVRHRHRHRQHRERPHRRDRAGRQSEEQHPQGQGSRRQEGRLHQSEIDQRTAAPAGAQGSRHDRQGRNGRHRRLRRRSYAARYWRRRRGAADRSDPDAEAGQVSRHLPFRRSHSAHDLAGRRHHAQVRDRSIRRWCAR